MSKPPKDPEGTRLPLRAIGIFLGAWMAVFVILALFVVPQAFASCAPPTP